MNPEGLVGVVEFVTDKPTHGMLELSDGERGLSIRFDKELQREQVK